MSHCRNVSIQVSRCGSRKDAQKGDRTYHWPLGRRPDGRLSLILGGDATMEPRLPCPSCGFLVFNEPPGSHDICPICYWEDDNVQLRFPDFAGGANKPSLMEAQRNFAEFGASEVRLLLFVRSPTEEDILLFVRSPTEEDIRDPDWRPVDPLRDLFNALDHHDGTDDWPTEPTRLYYWRHDFWRSGLRGRDS